jgi:hypothetical protein
VNLISESYRQQNKQLHEVGNYGISGHRHAQTVASLANQMGTRDILDYGCGRQTLQAALGYSIHNYDPCLPGFDSEPVPAALVVCGDVLEHIEPEYLDNVLDDIQRVTLNMAYLVIATRPAKKILPDGRNAHLIQEGFGWWAQRLADRFRVLSFSEIKTDLHFICGKLP